MKRELLDILVCPTCKGGLTLEVSLENEFEVISGSLYCRTCKVSYPIADKIPNLLPQR